MATYNQIIKQMEQQRIRISEQQREEIAKIYRDAAKNLGRNLSSRWSKSANVYYVIDYARELKEQSRYIYQDVLAAIQSGVSNTARAVTSAQVQYWSHVSPALMDRLRDHMSSIPQSVVDEILSGGLYHDGKGLSQRVWRACNQYERDIDYIINAGIIERKSAYDLAKDLEAYVLPDAKKPFDWSKIYPRCNKVVDYNAQRLARTACTHAYQMSFQRATRDNPFVESYQWHSSNSSRVCPLCRSRDGKIFAKDSVPLDHPNGMCIITAVISKSYDEIADEIAAWINGGSNPALDAWLS